MGRRLGGWVKKMAGLRSTNSVLQNSLEDVKDSIGNTVAEEYICVTRGHGQQCGDCLREWGELVKAGKGGKIWTIVIT